MKRKFTLKNISIALLLIFVLIQFIRIDKSNPPFDPANDFIVATNASSEISSILKTACYDCHSNEVIYPWYTNIAPFSWWIKHHVDEGVDELNFSEWRNYSARRMDKKLKEGIEMVNDDKMPLYSYTIMHGNAKLSPEQKTQLIDFFTVLRTGESDKPKP